MPSPYHTDRSLFFFWHTLVSLSVLAPMAYIGDYGRFVPKLKTVLLTLCVSFLGFFGVFLGIPAKILLPKQDF